VFNGDMKRLFMLSGTAAALGAGLMAGPGSAKVIELGAPKTAVAAPPPCTTNTNPGPNGVPKCPGGVIAKNYGILLTRVTALPILADGSAYPTMAKADGRIVAFTVGLSALDTNRTERRYEIQQADLSYGGTTRVQLTVLRRTGNKKDNQWKVTAQTAAFHVQPYLGFVVQIPLNRTLSVRRGDAVALTSPTWAPVLVLSQNSKKFAYRQSRKAACPLPPLQDQAQLKVGAETKYKCEYLGTRVAYSVTEVTSTPYPKHYVHAPDRPSADATAQSSHHEPSAMPLVTGGAGL
jgi:hypothetical protein